MPPPPIDTSGLRARTASLGGKFGDLDSLQIAIRLILLEYADNSRRAPSPLPGESAHTTYGVPVPVLRAVVNALRKRVSAAPLASLVLVDRLWQAGSLEERRIAAELLALAGPLTPAAALRLVEGWLARLADGDAADVLAAVGLATLLRADPAARLADIARWFEAPNEWARRFAAMAVATLAKEKAFHNPPVLLAALTAAAADPSAEVRRGVVTALWAIGPADPKHLAQFLRPLSETEDPAAAWTVRQTLAGLPADLQRTVSAWMKAEASADGTR